MELIDFRGLNCYYNCIVTVAKARGLNYPLSFAGLWSETDFKYDPYRRVYLTKRMLSELGAAGAALVMLPCDSVEEAAAGLAACDAGELIVVGMDAYHIPWNPLCGLHHGPHYFIAACSASDFLTCWDPTYGTSEARIARAAVTDHAFDISRMLVTPPHTAAPRVSDEAAAVLRTLLALRDGLLAAVRSNADLTRTDTVLLAKYVDELISNRRLFAYYLKTQTPIADGLFADRSYFAAWQAVKNGIYKLAVTASAATADEVCRLLSEVFAKETDYAEALTKV